MEIASIVRASLIDYEPYISCVVFTKGCNMRCPYCHNQALLDQPALDVEDIFSFIDSRKHLLDAVVISGGEPTLHHDLPEFIRQLKGFGLKVKLDTNGTNPAMLSQLIKEDLLDYVAMDIKGLDYQYQSLVGVGFESVAKSLEILKDFKAYELRTTCYPGIGKDNLETLCREYRGLPHVLQVYRPTESCEKLPFDYRILDRLGEKYQLLIRG